MAWTRKTWLWILAAVVGFCVICVIALAGFGMYFVSNHVKLERTSTAEAIRAFDDAKARFKDEKPLYDLDNMDKPRQLRNLADMPTSSVKTEMVWILVWDPGKEQLVRVSLPFWILRLGRQKVDISNGGFDFKRLQLDLKELQRVGPVMLVDHRTPEGERVFVWTQ